MEVNMLVVGIVCLLGLAFYQASGVLHDDPYNTESTLAFSAKTSYDSDHEILKLSFEKEEGEEEEEHNKEAIATFRSHVHGRRRLGDYSNGSEKKKKKQKKKNKNKSPPPPPKGKKSPPPPPLKENKSPPPPPPLPNNPVIMKGLSSPPPPFPPPPPPPPPPSPSPSPLPPPPAPAPSPPPPNFLESNVNQPPPTPNNGNMMNEIDACWRYDSNWENNRQHLADCAVGFGYNALGGKGGAIYVVTDAGDDPTSPKPGTLRYGATRIRPLWIVFSRDMVITLKTELVVNSYKTIDGRGYKVEIAYGQCFTIRHVNNVIIHGLHIHHCQPGGKGPILNSEGHLGESNGCDGDGIVVFDSKNIWIDHNSLSNGKDGLIDVIHASMDVTISNNYFTQHDKVMMLGHADSFTADKSMKVTVVYNHFGPGLVQRMPRCRWGYFHVANNRYTAWEMYAIGGSAKSTIRSEANYFFASSAKKVTKRESKDYSPESWNWRSINDLFLNGAIFEQSGSGTCPPYYTSGSSFIVQPASLVPTLTKDAGAIN